ncbi:DeoR/GlpR family DNA-binding transcription regulator [Lichenicoccus roseus]|nr:DeoR/GlpR family DNA-binding transcription regulator [Lichenicoccus roseus]
MPDERQRHILEHLSRSGRVMAIDLARRFGVSEDTARRDLRDLAAAGLCRRVYGGALPLSPATGTLRQRETEQVSRKAALGQAAADLLAKVIQPHQVLFLDAGSTNVAVARALSQELRITVVAHAPRVAAALADAAGIELVMIGGRVDPRSGAALGIRALRDLAAIRIDVALLGACAIDAAAGLAAFHLEDAEFKRAAAQDAAMVLSTATSGKLGTGAPFAVLPASRLAHLVVEADAPATLLEPFVALGIAIHRAGAAT